MPKVTEKIRPKTTDYCYIIIECFQNLANDCLMLITYKEKNLNVLLWNNTKP